MSTTTRPAPPWQIEEPGYEWVAVEDTDWTTDRPRLASGSLAADRCRFGKPPHLVPAAAWLYRPVWRRDTRQVPWAYCADHLYGRWIEDGKVMEWVVRDLEAARV